MIKSFQNGFPLKQEKLKGVFYVERRQVNLTGKKSLAL